MDDEPRLASSTLLNDAEVERKTIEIKAIPRNFCYIQSPCPHPSPLYFLDQPHPQKIEIIRTSLVQLKSPSGIKLSLLSACAYSQGKPGWAMAPCIDKMLLNQQPS